MSKRRRETAMMVGHRLDNIGGDPEQFEVYVDTGEWVNPPEPPAPVDPADEPVTLTRGELIDLVASAAAAAAVAHSGKPDPTGALRRGASTAARSAALKAME